MRVASLVAVKTGLSQTFFDAIDPSIFAYVGGCILRSQRLADPGSPILATGMTRRGQQSQLFDLHCGGLDRAQARMSNWR